MTRARPCRKAARTPLTQGNPPGPFLPSRPLRDAPDLATLPGAAKAVAMFRNLAEFEALTGADAPTKAERRLIRAMRAGEPCVLCDPDNPSLPSAATDSTSIRAPLLRLLITGGTPECGLHETGLRLVGGWIEGRLDLSYCAARGETLLNFCRFDETPSFYNAHLRQLDLEDSALPGLMAQGAKIDASLFLRRARSTGPVSVNSAAIGGHFSCTGAAFDGAGAAALNAQGVVTGQDLFLNKLTAKGSVDVRGARIGGQLACDGAMFDDAGGKALNAQGVEVGASLFLRNITAKGTVAVNSAKIGGQITCIGSRFDGAGEGAINAQGLRANQGLIFRELAARPLGLVDLSAAYARDLVDDSESWPEGPDNLILDGFTYDRIAGGNNTSLAARRRWLEAGSVWQGEFRPQPYSQLARVLRQMGHATEARKVLIAQAEAEARHGRQANRARRRFARQIRLLSRTITAERWEMVVQAAKALPASDADDATRVLDLFNLFHNPLAQPQGAPAPPTSADLALARQDFRNRMLGRAISCRLANLTNRIRSGFLSAVVGHGHAPHRALYVMALTVGIMALIYGSGWQAGVMVPNSDVILTSPDWRQAMAQDATAPTPGWTGTAPAQHYETFYSLAYAFDVFVPLVDIGQQAAWTESTVTWQGLTTRVLTMVLAVWGWIVTALAAAAITGLIQRNQPD